ncbi:MAG: ORF6N domain-containing protein [Planctomycetota bacterium]|nr:MAG: ORF6N domain-containing protein [Planctomycetota bacterium]
MQRQPLRRTRPRPILDIDVAQLYQVQTKRINEAVKNNPDKFPAGYIVELKKEEWDALKSKISTSTKGGKVKRPNAFTEKGLYMLATILKSPQATQTTLAIIETFAKIKRLSRTVKALSNVKDKSEQKTLMQKSGEIMAEILDENLEIDGSETSIELNFAVLKFKHTIKKRKPSTKEKK